MTRNTIIEDLKYVFKILRTIFSDTPQVVKHICEDYEETLYGEFKLIPKQFDEDIITGMTVAKIILKNIDVESLIKDLKKTGLIKNTSINSFKIITGYIDSLNKDSKTKAIYKNFLTKFKPLCYCIDKTTENPMKYLQKYSQLFSSENDFL